MIVIRLMGGLGNQLFQFALGRSLAQRSSLRVKYDRACLDRDPLRRYRLDCFDLTVDLATSSEVAKLVQDDRAGLRKILDTASQLVIPYHRRRIVVEQGTGFDPRILAIRHIAYLIGYWQDEAYFSDTGKTLRAQFVFRSNPNSLNQEYLEKIRSVEAVSLHVRRTDYLTNTKVNRMMAVCGLDYYKAAVQLLLSTIDRPHFFIFSDEPDWAQEHLQLKVPAAYVTHNQSGRDFEDLRLMSCCKHHIIANSSFSWWGAWLAENPAKQVIAPKGWFKDPHQNAHHRLPDGWLRI